jgi:predicted phosphodiesterase
MKFKDKKFKILILSDIHNPENMPVWTEKFILYAIQTEKPDLVVLLGDNIYGHYNGVTDDKNKKSLKKIVSLLGDTPFAVVFGNHDHEGFPEMSEAQAKKLIFDWYKESENCLMQQGDYFINIKDSKGEKDIFTLWFIDSGTYMEGSGYAYVKKDQLDWYEKECDKNGNLPSYLFQHIIFPEIFDLMKESRIPLPGYTKGQGDRGWKFYKFKKGALLSGKMNEGPCPPEINGGQFDVIKKKENMIACFFGHDHTNDFVCDCQGVKLANVPSPSYYTYGNNRGVRVVTLHEDDLTYFDSKVIHINDVDTPKPKNKLVDKWGVHKYERKTGRDAE